MKYKKINAKVGKYRVTIYEPKVAHSTKLGVVFGHCSPGAKEFYTWIGEDLASNGILTLLYSVPLMDQLSKEVSKIIRKIQGEEPPDRKFGLWLDGVRLSVAYLHNKYPTLKEIISIGHSMGGNACMGEIDGVDKVVALAPGWDSSGIPERGVVNDVSKTCNVPTLILMGSKDGITGEQASKNHYEQLPGKASLYIIPEGTHSKFMNNGLPYFIAKLLMEPEGDIPIEDQHAITIEKILGWIK